MKRWYLVSLVFLAVSLMVACQVAEAEKRSHKQSKKLLGDGNEVAAKSGVAPQSQTVEPVFIPADATLPTLLVTVEPPFVVAAQGIVSGGGITPGAPEQSTFTSAWLVAARTHSPQSISPAASPNEMLGYGAAAQLVTALTQIGNVAVIDYATYQKEPVRYPKIFVIKGTVTEYTETNQLDQKKKGWSTGPAGVLINTAGNILNVPGLSIGGQAMNIINAGKKTVTTTRTGMVGLSLQIIQTDTGQIVGAPTCQGTFATQSATQIKHGLGIENSQAEYQASALDQAGQAALNDAIGKIWETLKRQVTSQVAEVLPAQ
ncbi:MAG: hypothetical protein Q7T49_00065 [bacterium]|nr:hypothetical protein [bacterium]